MNGLSFRRKRRKKNGKSVKHKKVYNNGLRFEEPKERLHFAQEKIYKKAGGIKGLILWAAELLIVCMAAVFLVAAFGQRVVTAGDSMSPVIRNGDVVLVNKVIYNFKGPSRGDIVVFRQNEGEHDSIKRVVGLPGETVQIKDGKILIDGKELSEDIYKSDIEFAGAAADPVSLGEDEYFVIGDDPSASDDSRLPNIGNIKKEDISGTVWFIAGPFKNMGFV